MVDVPRSKEFDDVYFSPQDGLAETRYVFLDGNNLRARFTAGGDFTIAETGFGTGLNFLAAWALFDEVAAEGQNLHFISVEKHPLEGQVIRDALARWADELGVYVDALCAVYPNDCKGHVDLTLSDRVTLSLYFGDVNDVMPTWRAAGDMRVDAWFLDGFKPASNPDMWSEAVFDAMARLSVKGSSVATFTAAGFVRRALIAAGFDARKVKGFAHKWAMLVGEFRCE